MLTAGILRAARADFWAAEAAIRPDARSADVPGAVLFSRGVGPQSNIASVLDVEGCDVALIGQWFGEQAWSATVPLGGSWPHARLLREQRLMGLELTGLVPAPGVEGLVIRPAGPADLDIIGHIDGIAFDEATDLRWLAPHLAGPPADTALAMLDGVPAGCGYTLQSHGQAGPAAFLGGVATLPQCRGRGVAAAVSTWLLHRAVTAGVAYAHLSPDSQLAARVYARLGFREVDGMEIYVPDRAGCQ